MANEDWGVEIVEPGAFRSWLDRLERKAHAQTAVNRMHQVDQVVARTGAGLTLIDDDDALRCEIRLANTHYGRMVAEEIDAGIIRGLCPEFTVSEAWYSDIPGHPGKQVRHVTEAILWNIAFVDTPGLPDSVIQDWVHYGMIIDEWPAYHDRIYGLKVLDTVLERMRDAGTLPPLRRQGDC